MKGYKIIFLVVLFATKTFGQIIPSNHFTTNNGLPSSEVYSIYQDTKDRYWICTDNGVSLFNGSGFRNFNIENGLLTNTIFSCFENKIDGKLWFITYGFGLCYYDEPSGCFKQPPYNKELIGVFNKKFINSTQFDDGGNLWITYDYHRYLKITPEGNIVHFPESIRLETGGFEIIKTENIELIRNIFGFKSSKNIEYSVIKSGQNLLIQGNYTSNYTAAKLLKINDSLRVIAYSNELIFIQNVSKVNVVHFSCDILSLMKDGGGNLWIGTHKNGIYFLAKESFNVKPLHYSQFNNLSVSSILQDKYGKIWFTTLSNGLYCLPNKDLRNYILNQKVSKIFQNTNSFTFITLGAGVFKTINSNFNLKQEKNNLEIKDIKMGPNGKIYKCKAIYNKVIPTHLDIENISANSIEFFDKYFYVAGKTFLIQYNYSNNLEKFFAVPSPVIKICKLNRSTILAGCLNGLYLFRNENFKPVTKPQWLKETRINSVKISSDKVYVLTDGRGLLIYDKADLNNFIHVNPPSSHSINCMDLFKDSILWLGTNDGIFKLLKINAKKYTVDLHISIKDGLPSNEVNDIKLFEKKVLVATNSGLSIFMQNIQSVHRLYPIYFNSILGNMLDTLYHGYSRNIDIKVNKKYRDLYVKLATNKETDYISTTSLEYKLILDGKISQDWTTVMVSDIQFTNLEPGHYNLQIRTKDEIENSTFISEAKFYISPYYYEKTWVKLVFFSILFLLISLIFVLVLKRLQRENELKRKMAKAEINSLRNQMNPHFIFNALNAVQNFIFDNNQEKAAKFLSKFSNLIRKSLEFSKLNFISVKAELGFIEDYLAIEKMRFQDKFEYEIDISPDIDLENSFIPPLLMQPLIENSIKHGFRELERGGKIKIHLWIEEKDVLNYSILDNGSGIKQNLEKPMEYKTSLSHNILKERFLLLKDDLKTSASIGMELKNLYFDGKFGTYIILKLPLKYD